MTSAKLIFDVSGFELEEAIARIVWRLDPIRKVAQKSDENVGEIAIIGVDKVKFEDEVANSLAEIAKLDKAYAIDAASIILRIALKSFLKSRDSRAYKGKITVNPKKNRIKEYVYVDLKTDKPQYNEMKKDITNIEGTTEQIKRGTKSVLNDTLTPMFGHLSASLSEIKASHGASLSEIKATHAKRFDEIERLLKNLQPK